MDGGLSTRCKPTVIDSRYWFNFLEISYASLLRAIRVRFFVQPKHQQVVESLVWPYNARLSSTRGYSELYGLITDYNLHLTPRILEFITHYNE